MPEACRILTFLHRLRSAWLVYSSTTACERRSAPAVNVEGVGVAYIAAVTGDSTLYLPHFKLNRMLAIVMMSSLVLIASTAEYLPIAYYSGTRILLVEDIRDKRRATANSNESQESKSADIVSDGHMIAHRAVMMPTAKSALRRL
jgi:hypothetical protein